MQLKTDGLVIRELNVGESDRIVTILTRSQGVIRASAKGARTVKSRMTSATQLLSYGNFALFRGREKYIIDEVEPQHLFLGVRRDLERLSLAQYFAELEGFLAPQEDEAEIYLRLILNALALTEKGTRPLPLLKAAFEMRLLTMAGYMPDLVACRRCGAFEHDVMFLEPAEGTLTCGGCAADGENGCALSRGALAAMRHTVYADFERLFSFELPEGPLSELARASERYLLCTLDRNFPTLEFYNGLRR